MNEKMSLKKILINLLIMFTLSYLVFKTIFRLSSTEDLSLAIKNSRKIYILLGCSLSIIYMMGEAINLKIILSSLGYQLGLKNTIKYAFGGFFYSSITPGASGGQPMQIYEMKKDGVEIVHSSISLLLIFMTTQLVAFTLEISGFLYFRNTQVLEETGLKYFVIIGLIIRLIGIIFILLTIFSPSISNKICIFLEFIISRLPVFRDDRKKKIIDTIKVQIGEYNNCARFIRDEKSLLLKVLAIAVVQMISLFSTAYMAYLALRQTRSTYASVLLIQSLVHAATSYMPIPGSVGASETSYIILFKTIYEKNILASALIISRLGNFYFPLILSGLTILIYKIYEIGRKSGSKKLVLKHKGSIL